ncbi:MAG: sugar ABC transporter ATP-binding protein [Rhizobiales bacterium]|nr:sugar ABC transporter ATP-binding protein [Hyphomicrobiales bacterium]
MSTASADEPHAAPGHDTIVVRNVKKYFGPTRALDGVNFSARAGEIHAVVGGNGCGNSGILPVDGGSVSILGEAPSTPAESRGLGISTVYQEILVADESSVVDNLFMGIDPLFSRKLSQERKVRRAAELMQELAGEPVDPHALVGTLPLGLKQWVVIGRALVSDPKVLILDESSAALDFDSTERLFAKMRALRDSGVTVLIVTHRIAELIRISDRATVLRDGRDVGVLERQDITERNLLRLMTGEEEEEIRSHEPPMPRSSAPALRASGLRLTPSARSFDFLLRRGEIVGIAGLDGQGQDAFVRVLSGVAAPLAGQVEVQGSDGTAHLLRSLADAVANRVVYVSGDRKREGIFASLSILENMVIPLYREKRKGGVLGIIDFPALGAIFKREAENLLIKFGAREDRITSLSGGNQQKVLIGRGFAMRPDVIVLNDPARGIDVGAKNELYRHLRSFAADGRSVVYLSSEIEEFLGFCTRVIVFRDGAPFDAFDGRALEGRTVLEAMFGQTDGSGLESALFGPVPLRGVAGEAPPAEQHRTVSDIQPASPARRPIRIVEFDQAGARTERRAS